MNPYKVLGIRPNASLDEIKDAYESLANTYNTNEFNGSPEEFLAEDKLSEINDAYTFLVNDLKYKDIRTLIENKQFLSAETELNLLGDKNSPEWNYLKGFVLLKKGWFQAGVTHLKAAVELNPSNSEYQEALMVIAKKVKQMKVNYAKATRYNSANSSNNSMCGGSGQSNNMCGGSGSGGGGIDPNILNLLMNSAGNSMGANPMAGNPMSNTPPNTDTPNTGMNSSDFGGNSNPMSNLGNMMGGMGSNPMSNLGNMMGGMGSNPMSNLGNMMSGMGSNPMQNMLLQSLMGGGNGMNMCGNSGGSGMC